MVTPTATGKAVSGCPAYAAGQDAANAAKETHDIGLATTF